MCKSCGVAYFSANFIFLTFSQSKSGGHYFEGKLLIKTRWRLAGQINCKLQQGMKKPLKPLQFQGFLEPVNTIDAAVEYKSCKKGGAVWAV